MKEIQGEHKEERGGGEDRKLSMRRIKASVEKAKSKKESGSGSVHQSQRWLGNQKRLRVRPQL